jgi:hypothetical protein
MTLDRYSKLVLKVIAVCLVWLSLGGPSLITPVHAQLGDRVMLAGWVDEKGTVRPFPEPIWARDANRRITGADVRAAEALPIWNTSR